jgi:hypothetical protein
MKCTMSKKILFISFLISFNLSWAANNCNPIGQLSYMSNLKSNSVEFLAFDTKPLLSKAQINTLNCNEKKHLLTSDKYQVI